jgi:hypothetical protein
MLKLSVMYPKSENLKFDMDYDRESHVPMMRRLIGERLKGFSVDRACAACAAPRHGGECQRACGSGGRRGRRRLREALSGPGGDPPREPAPTGFSVDPGPARLLQPVHQKAGPRRVAFPEPMFLLHTPGTAPDKSVPGRCRVRSGRGNLLGNHRIYAERPRRILTRLALAQGLG